MRDWWRPNLTDVVARLRTGGRAAVLWSGRITVAAVASYVVATLIFPGTQPLLAPLTAMLVVQVTPVSLLASGLDRVLAVVAGVLVAVAFAAVVPLEWWSLGLLILVSITIGQALRLRSNLIEVPISGMLVLGVGSFSAGSAAWERIAETLVGAAVGVAANLLFPPKVASADAGTAIDALADRVSELLTRSADELAELLESGGDVVGPAGRWLGEARRITHEIPEVGAALLKAEQGRRLNVRAVGTADLGPGLRQGLESLEHSAVALRSLFRSLLDATRDPAWPADAEADRALAELVPTLREMAACVDAFGQLVHDEADSDRRLRSGDVQAVTVALAALHETQLRLENRLPLSAGPVLVELHGAVLSTVKRLLSELDLDERVRGQIRLGLLRPRPSRASREGGGQEPDPEDETQVLPRVPPDPPT